MSSPESSTSECVDLTGARMVFNDDDARHPFAFHLHTNESGGLDHIMLAANSEATRLAWAVAFAQEGVSHPAVKKQLSKAALAVLSSSPSTSQEALLPRPYSGASDDALGTCQRATTELPRRWHQKGARWSLTGATERMRAATYSTRNSKGTGTEDSADDLAALKNSPKLQRWSRWHRKGARWSQTTSNGGAMPASRRRSSRISKSERKEPSKETDRTQEAESLALAQKAARSSKTAVGRILQSAQALVSPRPSSRDSYSSLELHDSDKVRDTEESICTENSPTAARRGAEDLTSSMRASRNSDEEAGQGKAAAQVFARSTDTSAGKETTGTQEFEAMAAPAMQTTTPATTKACDSESTESQPYGMPTPLDLQRGWLGRMLELGISKGLDSPPMFRGTEGDAAARLQAIVRGRAARLRHGDAIQTAVVVAAARKELEDSTVRAKRRMNLWSFVGRKTMLEEVRHAQSHATLLEGKPLQNSSQSLRALSGCAPGGDAMSKAPLPSYGAAEQKRLCVPAIHAHVRASTTERLQVLHALARLHAADSSKDTFDAIPGDRRGPKFKQLARAQHWRRCPQCFGAVEHRQNDGSAVCQQCRCHFGWARAELVVPVASLKELLQEARWDYEELKASGKRIGYLDVARLHLGRTDWPPRTAALKGKLLLWRGVVGAPFAVALFALTPRERSRQRSIERTRSLIEMRSIKLAEEHPLADGQKLSFPDSANGSGSRSPADGLFDVFGVIESRGARSPTAALRRIR